MRFFCVKNTCNSNGKAFDDMVRVILQTPPELRSDDDHNKVFSYFHHDIYLNTLEKTRGIAKLLLSVSVLQGMRLDSNESASLSIKDIQYLIVIQGELKTDQCTHKQKSCLLQKDLHKIEQSSIQRNGCFIAYLTKQRYQQLLNYQLQDIRQKVQELKKFGILKQITQTHLLYLAYKVISQTYRFRQYVYKIGDQSEYAYFILSGTFELVRKFKAPKFSYESSITSIESGQSFGEDCIFLQRNRESEIRSLSCDNLVYKIPVQCLVDVYNEYPKLKQALIKTIQDRRMYIEKRSLQIEEAHKDNQKVKNNTLIPQADVKLPQIRQKSLSKQKFQSRFTRDKTSQQFGLELVAQTLDLSKFLFGKEKPVIQISKKTILRSLGANYLVEKLHKLQTKMPSQIINQSQPDLFKKAEGVFQSILRFPLIQNCSRIENVNLVKPKKKCQNRYMIKPKILSSDTELLRCPTDLSLNKMFLLS